MKGWGHPNLYILLSTFSSYLYAQENNCLPNISLWKINIVTFLLTFSWRFNLFKWRPVTVLYFLSQNSLPVCHKIWLIATSQVSFNYAFSLEFLSPLLQFRHWSIFSWIDVTAFYSPWNLLSVLFLNHH